MISKILNKILNSYFLQFLIITFFVFAAFYKTLGFSFHANREIGWLMSGGTGFIGLMRSHGFINIINYKVYGANAWGWYLTAIIFHILATCMMIIFVNKLTKNKALGFITGLWFSVSMAWLDAITFGSQDSVYEFQLFIFFIGIIFYRNFRQTNNFLSYFITLICFAVLLPLRESGLLFFPIIFFYDLIFHITDKLKLKHFFNLRLLFKNSFHLLPFFVLAVLYLLVRNSYGGSPNDFADGRVKLAHYLLTDHQYLKYIKYGIFIFGTYIPTHFIPYPFLNFIRSLILTIYDNNTIRLYFFSVLGYSFYGILFLGYIKKRKTKIAKLLLFSLIILAIPTFFYSYAFTSDEPFLLRDYGYDENRWRYVSFFGTSLYLTVYFSDFLNKVFKNKKLKKIVISMILVSNLVLNISLVWKTQDQMYEEMFKSQKLFYKTFKQVFPVYPKDRILYSYPFSYQLGDYLWEWYGLKEFYYPNLTSLPTDWSYGEMEKVLEVFKTDPSVFSKFRYITFDMQNGVVDHTNRVNQLLKNQKTVVFNPQQEAVKPLSFNITRDEISPIEIPYDFEITMKADKNYNQENISLKNNLSKEKRDSLADYAKNHTELKDKKIDSVCNTRGHMKIFDPKHLTDGVYGQRSLWWADCLPAWFILDLGREYKIKGFIMGGVKDDPLTPLSYFYEVSKDNKIWEKVMEVKNNKRFEMMDEWPKVYNARFIRVSILVTHNGSFPIVDEAEPVLETAASIFNFWDARSQLMSDLYNTQNSKIDFSFGRFTWKTNLTNIPQDQTTFYFPFTIDGQYHTYQFPIYESEHYGTADQFLKRYIENINIDFSNFSGTVVVDNIKLVPRIPL